MVNGVVNGVIVKSFAMLSQCRISSKPPNKVLACGLCNPSRLPASGFAAPALGWLG
jgi:hypothetical protein